MATVTINAVSHSFGQQCILKDIQLPIDKGEFVVIVGPSGCGKSTLLRLIAGLDKVDTGTILINDVCVNDIPPPLRDIAMVFQNYALYPHMTVYDNMAYGLKMRRVKKADIHERVQAVGDMLQLLDCMQRKPYALSGGQRQRVAMGRAIVRSPAVFLFDEPLSNLDFKLRTEMRHEIKKLHQKLKATCIYVTHDQTEAMTLATRLVVLNRGRIEQIGTPRAVYDYPDSMFVASFLGHFPMNFIPATLDSVGPCLRLSTGTALRMPSLHWENSEQNALVVGVRPEHLMFVSTHELDSIPVVVMGIDDMGADQLVRVNTEIGGVAMMVRVPGDKPVHPGRCFVKIALDRAAVFCAGSEKRLGGWDA